jgi:hypothetical protein
MPSDVTQILSQIESGDPSAAEQLLSLVYEELRKLAAPTARLCRMDGTLHHHSAGKLLAGDEG